LTLNTPPEEGHDMHYLESAGPSRQLLDVVVVGEALVDVVTSVEGTSEYPGG